MLQSRASPGLHGIKPWLCENLVDLHTTVFTTYDDKRLMAYSGAIIVVGTAKRITQETIGFLIEMDDTKTLFAKQFYPSTVATWHRQDALKAIESNRPLLSVMESRERAAKPPQRRGSKAIVRELISAEFTKKNGRFEELDTAIQEALVLEASIFGGIPQIVERFYETAFEIYNSSLRAPDQTRRLIALWQERNTVIRDHTKR